MNQPSLAAKSVRTSSSEYARAPFRETIQSVLPPRRGAQCFVAIGLLALVGCASAPPPVASPTTAGQAQSGGVTTASAVPVSPLLHWVWPKNPSASPIPAVVLMHGCAGLGQNGVPNPRHRAAAQWLADRGYVAVLVDSLTPRGEKELCTQPLGQRKLTPAGRVPDAYFALDALARDPRVDASRVAVWGWSHGGSVTLHTVMDPRAQPTQPERLASAPKFKAAVAFYPGCSVFNNNAARMSLNLPLQVLIGEADDWTPAAPCVALTQKLSARGAPIAIKTYPGAHHGFDAPGDRATKLPNVPNGVNPGQGVTVGAHPASREDAMKVVEAFLARHLH